jgi:hypothetical protein
MEKSDIENKCKEYNQILDDYISSILYLKIPEDCNSLDVIKLYDTRRKLFVLNSLKNRKNIEHKLEEVQEYFGNYLQELVNKNIKN